AARLFSRSATQIFRAGNRAAGKQAPDVDHLVELHRGEDALQAARASTLLYDEGDRKCAFQSGRIGFSQQLEKRGGAQTVSRSGARKFSISEIREAPVDSNRIQNIHARFTNFVGRKCANVYIHLVEII